MTCWHDDRSLLLDTISAGRIAAAVDLMRDHLQTLFDELDLSREAGIDVDPRRVFRLQR